MEHKVWEEERQKFWKLLHEHKVTEEIWKRTYSSDWKEKKEKRKPSKAKQKDSTPKYTNLLSRSKSVGKKRGHTLYEDLSWIYNLW